MKSISTIMKAIRIHKFGSPQVLQVEEVEIPKPQKHEVLVRVKAVGVNPVDTYIRAGNYGPREMPFTPGSDASGTVVSVGSDIKNVKVGERVYCCDLSSRTGSYGEYMVAKSTRVFHLPEALSFNQGAAIGVPYFTALRAIRYIAGAKSGERILIHGASGGVGLAACQIAKMLNLEVYGTASTEIGRKLVLENGAGHVLNHKHPDHLQNLRDVTGGKGFDIIIEMLANVNLPTDMEVLADKGRIAVVGSRGKVSVDPRSLMNTEASCVGVKLAKTTDVEWHDMELEILKGIKESSICPVIGEVFPLEAAAEAHKAVLEHADGARGKLVLVTDVHEG